MIRALVAEPDSLVLRPRCHVLYDVIATDGAGQEAMVAAGLEEEAARELFHAATGEKWTREALEAREQPYKTKPPAVGAEGKKGTIQ